MTVLKNFVREEGGADLIEYALLAGLIAFACVVAMTALGGSLNGFFTATSTKLNSITP
jgi:pilus assembly protein Flp/PilA